MGLESTILIRTSAQNAFGILKLMVHVSNAIDHTDVILRNLHVLFALIFQKNYVRQSLLKS